MVYFGMTCHDLPWLAIYHLKNPVSWLKKVVFYSPFGSTEIEKNLKVKTLWKNKKILNTV
jgi:hypothetical protein